MVKVKDIIYIFLITVLFCLYLRKNRKVENFSNMNKKEMEKLIQSVVGKKYLVDLEAIRNLSDVATKLQKGSLTIPGNLKIKGYVIDGKWNNKYLEYYDNGQLREEAEYIKGTLEGIFIFYFKSGAIKEKRNYKNGKLEGNFYCYYKNKKVWIKNNYVNGKLDGERLI